MFYLKKFNLAKRPILNSFHLPSLVSTALILLTLMLVTLMILSNNKYVSELTKNNDLRIRSGGLEFSKSSPLIFVGGVPRSGTTLMRVILDSHPDVRCGEETHVIPVFIREFSDWYGTSSWKQRLMQAGVMDDTMLKAASEFVLRLIVGHGDPAPRLCNKDPLVLRYTKVVQSMFPNAKFLLMIRDGRAVAHSVVTKFIPIRNFNTSTQATTLASWNKMVTEMADLCDAVGSGVCLKVFYEQLVLHPEKITRQILDFLNLEWTPDLLKHEEFVGKSGGISLSKLVWYITAV